MSRDIQHFISGRQRADADRFANVFDPNTGAVQARVGFGTAATVDCAVHAAREALPGWMATNPQRRARVMLAFRALAEKHIDELAHLLSSEHGKVIADRKTRPIRAS